MRFNDGIVSVALDGVRCMALASSKMTTQIMNGTICRAVARFIFLAFSLFLGAGSPALVITSALSFICARL